MEIHPKENKMRWESGDSFRRIKSGFYFPKRTDEVVFIENVFFM